MSGIDKAGAKRPALDVLDAVQTKRPTALSPEIEQRYSLLFEQFKQKPAINMVLCQKQPEFVVNCYRRACEWYNGSKRQLRIVAVLNNILSVYNSDVFKGHFRLSALQVVDLLQTLQCKSVAECPVLSADDRFTHVEAESLQQVYQEMPDDIALFFSSRHTDAASAITHVTDMIISVKKNQNECTLIEDMQAASTTTLQAEDSRLSFEVVLFVMMSCNFESEPTADYINKYLNPERRIEGATLVELAQHRRAMGPEKLHDVVQDKHARAREALIREMHEDNIEEFVMPAMTVSDADAFVRPFMQTVKQNVQHLENVLPADGLAI